VSAAEWRSRLDAAMRAAADAEAAPTPAKMRRVRDALALPVAVALPDGIVTLERDAFLDGLAGTTRGDFADAVEHLSALREAFEAVVVAPPSGDARVAAALPTVMAGIHVTPGLAQRIRDWFTRALQSALDTLGRAASTVPGVIVGVAILVLVVLAAIALTLRRARLVPERRAERTGATTVEDPAATLANALARGDLEAALRAQFALMLAALSVTGVVDDDPSLTAGEARAAVQARRVAIAPAVDSAAAALERVVYGERPPAREDLDVVRRATELARTS
jgi:hypothetical protein